MLETCRKFFGQVILEVFRTCFDKRRACLFAGIIRHYVNVLIEEHQKNAFLSDNSSALTQTQRVRKFTFIAFVAFVLVGFDNNFPASNLCSIKEVSQILLSVILLICSSVRQYHSTTAILVSFRE